MILNKLMKVFWVFLVMFLFFNSLLLIPVNALPIVDRQQKIEEAQGNIDSENNPSLYKNIPPQDSGSTSDLVTDFCGGESSSVSFFIDDNARGASFSRVNCDKLWYEANLQTVCQDSPFCIYNFNDEVSSIRFDKGFNVPITLWIHSNYRGACVVFRVSEDGKHKTVNLRPYNWNDKISSVAFGDYYKASPYNCQERFILD
jgi:hypothetical protein